MGVKHKKKAKPFSEHKIELNKWKMFFSANIASEGLATEEVSDRIVALMAMLTMNHLLCHECGRVLDDEEYYKQAVHVARRGRAQICKQCWKTTYRSRS